MVLAMSPLLQYHDRNTTTHHSTPFSLRSDNYPENKAGISLRPKLRTCTSDPPCQAGPHRAVIARLNKEPEVPGCYPDRPHTFVFPSVDSRREVVRYWRKFVHEVLVKRLGGLSLPRKSVVRLTDRPDMISAIYRGRKTTTQ